MKRKRQKLEDFGDHYVLWTSRFKIGCSSLHREVKGQSQIHNSNQDLNLPAPLKPDDWISYLFCNWPVYV